MLSVFGRKVDGWKSGKANRNNAKQMPIDIESHTHEEGSGILLKNKGGNDRISNTTTQAHHIRNDA